MSKIAEQKAWEAYPIIEGNSIDWGQYEDLNEYPREGYIVGYDQAMQDFLEKAERYLKNTLYDRVEIKVFGTVIPSIVSKKEFIDNFKNYMKNEI